MPANGWNHAAHETILRIWDILQVNWHIGFTAFGGPPVHFKIVSKASDLPLTSQT
jgi:hypothetical protein